MKIKGWKQTLNNILVYTGGGLNYKYTFYKNTNNILRQIEIIVDDWDTDDIILNIGNLPKGTLFSDLYFTCQGDYIFTKKCKSVFEAKQYAMKYMRANPNG